MSDTIGQSEPQTRRFGARFVLRALLHPLVSPFTNAAALFGTLRNSGVLFGSRWRSFLNYRPPYAVTMLFYWTHAVQLKRHGRTGISPTLGDGEFPLTRWWHLTLPSTYAFHALGIAGVIGAAAFWWLTHLLWLGSANWPLVAATMLVILLSSTFFSQAFVTQNYNVFGWMFMPAALWGLLAGHPLVALLAWLAASFASLTMIAVGCVLSAAFAFEASSFVPILLIAPAALKIAGQVLWILSRDRSGALVALLKAIGLSNRGVRYRHQRARFFGGGFLYTTGLLGLFTGACWWFAAPGRWLMAAALAASLINQKVARFADPQSMQITSLSVATAVVLAAGEPYLLIPLWLLANPFPFMADVTAPGDDPLRLPVLAPVDVGPYLDAVDDFFAPVKPGQRVLFLLPDPGTDHDAVFADYRSIMEIAFHVGTRRSFLVLPDWYFVYRYNYPDAPDCWADTPAEAAAQAKAWSADYLVAVEPATGASAPPGFAAAGRRLEWSRVGDRSAERPWGNLPAPVWTLLERAGPSAAPDGRAPNEQKDRT